MPHSSPHPAQHPIASGNDSPGFTATCPPDAQAIDEMIRQAGSHAAKLLWMVALASDAVSFDLLQELWHADLQASADLQKLQAMLDKLANLPPDLAQRREAIVQSLPPVVLAQLEKLKASPPSAAPALALLLADLLKAGLLIETARPLESPAPDSAPTLAYACPQPVRARSLALAGADFDAKPIWLAYAKHENLVCHAAKNTHMTAAIAAASRALAYYMQAEDYGAVANFLNAFNTDQPADQRLAESLLPQLQPAPEAIPDTPEMQIASANAAKHAAFARHDWAGALPHIDTMLRLKPTLQPPAEATDMGVDHFNRAHVLIQLARFDEARIELDICQDIFKAEPDMLCKVHGQLAALLAMQGDLAQAIAHQRTGLALLEGMDNENASQAPGSLPDPRDRVISHNNLADYLTRTNMARDYIEASYHQIAVLAYSLCVPEKEQALRRKWAVGVLKARIASNKPLIPPLAEVLAQEAFAPLAHWLQRWQAENHSTMAQLQAQLDEIAAQVLKPK
jgi:hypothetical protein